MDVQFTDPDDRRNRRADATGAAGGAGRRADGDADARRRRRRYRRLTTARKRALFDRMLEKKSREKLTWTEVARAFRVGRPTLSAWRRTEEWRLAEARWRRILREETRSDAAALGPDALRCWAP